MQRYQNELRDCSDDQLALVLRIIYEEDVSLFKVGEAIKLFLEPLEVPSAPIDSWEVKYLFGNIREVERTHVQVRSHSMRCAIS